MRPKRLAVLFAFLVLLPAGAPAAENDPGRVVEIVDGDTLVLDDGREFRMTGIQAPKLPLGRKGFAKWPLADEAKAALADLAYRETVRPEFDARRMDRHGRWLAQLYRADGTWLQGEMIGLGLARVYTFADNNAWAGELLALEREARAAGRGIWDHPFYAIRTPEEAGDHLDTFQIVEGTVLGTAIIRKRGFLNFGENYKTDFTVVVEPEDMRTFTDAHIDIRAFAGKNIRVRGWVRSFNGPMIEATHPEQIEVLD